MAVHARRSFDERGNGFAPGLETALSDQFFAQLEALEAGKGKRCPGETSCRQRIIEDEDGRELPNPDAGPLGHPANGDRTPDQICGKCSLRGTKPGSEPPHLTQFLTVACRLDKLRDAGATFVYPQSLPSPYLWAALVGSKDGRNRHEDARAKRQEEERRRKEREAELQRLLNQGN